MTSRIEEIRARDLVCLIPLNADSGITSHESGTVCDCEVLFLLSLIDSQEALLDEAEESINEVQSVLAQLCNNSSTVGERATKAWNINALALTKLRERKK